jgi:Tat protein secretion system quality control protein TatD with DNase activity
MVRTAEAIATAKGLTLEEVARVTTANAIRFFNLGGARA